jgi:hypothetical protein
MARYFFDFEGSTPYLDAVGEDLPDDDAAWLEAMRLAKDMEGRLRPGQSWHLDVRNGDRFVYSVEVITRRRDSLPEAELVAEFTSADRPSLAGYHVVVDGRPVALITVGELALAGFTAVEDVQTFEIAQDVRSGSILFWHPGDQKLHSLQGQDGIPIGVTTKDFPADSVVRMSSDGVIILDGEFNLSEEEFASIARHQAAG